MPTPARLLNDLQVEYMNVQCCTSCSSERHVTEVTDVTDLGRTPPMGGLRQGPSATTMTQAEDIQGGLAKIRDLEDPIRELREFCRK